MNIIYALALILSTQAYAALPKVQPPKQICELQLEGRDAKNLAHAQKIYGKQNKPLKKTGRIRNIVHLAGSMPAEHGLFQQYLKDHPDLDYAFVHHVIHKTFKKSEDRATALLGWLNLQKQAGSKVDFANFEAGVLAMQKLTSERRGFLWRKSPLQMPPDLIKNYALAHVDTLSDKNLEELESIAGQTRTAIEIRIAQAAKDLKRDRDLAVFDRLVTKLSPEDFHAFVAYSVKTDPTVFKTATELANVIKKTNNPGSILYLYVKENLATLPITDFHDLMAQVDLAPEQISELAYSLLLNRHTQLGDLDKLSLLNLILELDPTNLILAETMSSVGAKTELNLRDVVRDPAMSPSVAAAAQLEYLRRNGSLLSAREMATTAAWFELSPSNSPALLRQVAQVAVLAYRMKETVPTPGDLTILAGIKGMKPEILLTPYNVESITKWPLEVAENWARQVQFAGEVKVGKRGVRNIVLVPRIKNKTLSHEEFETRLANTDRPEAAAELINTYAHAASDEPAVCARVAFELWLTQKDSEQRTAELAHIFDNEASHIGLPLALKYFESFAGNNLGLIHAIDGYAHAHAEEWETARQQIAAKADWILSDQVSKTDHEVREFLMTMIDQLDQFFPWLKAQANAASDENVTRRLLTTYAYVLMQHEAALREAEEIEAQEAKEAHDRLVEASYKDEIADMDEDDAIETVKKAQTDSLASELVLIYINANNMTVEKLAEMIEHIKDPDTVHHLITVYLEKDEPDSNDPAEVDDFESMLDAHALGGAHDLWTAFADRQVASDESQTVDNIMTVLGKFEDPQARLKIAIKFAEGSADYWDDDEVEKVADELEESLKEPFLKAVITKQVEDGQPVNEMKDLIELAEVEKAKDRLLEYAVELGVVKPEQDLIGLDKEETFTLLELASTELLHDQLLAKLAGFQSIDVDTLIDSVLPDRAKTDEGRGMIAYAAVTNFIYRPREILRIAEAVESVKWQRKIERDYAKNP